MSDACEFCHTPYVRGRDPDDNAWRSLCKCESHQRCFKGAHYATHARELDDAVVFACDRHGVSLDDRAAVAVLPPEPSRERRAKAETPAEDTPRKPREAPPPTPPRPALTPEEYADIYAEETWLTTCRCGVDTPRCTRVWRRGEWIATNPTSGYGKGFHAIESHCPACDAPDRDPETGDLTWRRKHPEVEPPAHPQHTTRKKRR